MIAIGDLLGMSLASLLQNKFRALLSLLGITIGIAAVYVIINVSQGGRQVIFSELESLGLTSAWVYRDYEPREGEELQSPGHSGILIEDFEEIQSNCCREVSLFSPVVRFKKTEVAGLKRIPLLTDVQGVNERFLLGNGYPLLQGRKLSVFDVEQRHKVAIVTESVRDDLGLSNNNVIGNVIDLFDQPFTIVGLVKNKDLSFLSSIGSIDSRGINNTIYIPHSVALSLKNSSMIDSLYLETFEVEDAKPIAQNIAAQLEQRSRGRFRFRSETMDSYINVAESILGNVAAIGLLSAFATVIVGSIGIMNMMSTSVVERTSEIGLRKAIGASSADIKGQILLESIALTGVGSLIGLMIGIGATALASLLLDIEQQFTLWSVIVSIGITLIVGLVSGYIPARRAANISPVEALNHE